jgi:acetylornithine deacetylase/succinyl-diaminopimelate desuccinylase-like protein
MMGASVDEVVALIDRDELVRLTLEICNIDSPVGHELAVAKRLEDWFRDEDFPVRRIGLLADRYNLLARLPGTAGGRPSLMFNGHVDTFAPSHADLVLLDPMRDELHKAWVEGDLLVGDGVVNDKGPIAAFMIAAKAIKDSGRRLKGELLLSAVVAETAYEQADGPPGEIIDTKELGARFLATHGGIADYVLVAEGTGFGIVWIECGKAWFKVTLRSRQPSFYTPYMPERTNPAQSPNMIVAAGAAIDAIERWADNYERRSVLRSPGGEVRPKVQIGAIRSGEPTRPIMSPQMCSLYLDVRTLPGANPLDLRDEIGAALAATGIDHDIELYLFRPGYEAKGVEPLIAAVSEAHRAVVGGDPPPVCGPTASMWRDSNVFAELGIPVVNYGPRSASHAYKRALTIESLYQAACVYARTALAICG